MDPISSSRGLTRTSRRDQTPRLDADQSGAVRVVPGSLSNPSRCVLVLSS